MEASEHGTDRIKICARICHHKYYFKKEINIQRESLLPSKFKEKGICWEDISSHLEGSVNTRMRDSWKFPANAVFVQANAVFGYLFFK